MAQTSDVLTLEDAQKRILELEERLAEKEEDLRRRYSELALLNRVSQAFNSTFDLDHILITVLEEVRRLLEVDACSIWLKDQTTDELVCEYAIGPYSQTVHGWRLAPGQGLAGAVAKSGESVIVADVSADQRHFRGVDQRTGQMLRSILTVPMKVKQEIIGVLQVLDSEADRFTSTDRVLQELLATTASIAIENARLNERLWYAAEAKALLVEEINARGKNNLAIIVELLFWAQSASSTQNTTFQALPHLLDQVRVLMTVNSFLAEFEWNPFPFNDLCSRVIHTTLKLLTTEIEIYVAVLPSSLRISPKYANSFALILYELVTNAVKHAFTDRSSGHITVQVTLMDHTVHFEFRDDGHGYENAILEMNQLTPGLALIQKIVRDDLRGELTFYNSQGAVAMIRCKSLLSVKPK
ncbi:serine phosphatase [Candidatus Moduliflexus flocculans]|uniref:histidine kinase n=1 Tax=Candidatus Moduliflexus flocculans TaxID=1499966 RepID=A0A0S6W576_9BACT|nr:serine phosphatase [Candidatus Moduliflexus flocculans]